MGTLDPHALEDSLDQLTLVAEAATADEAGPLLDSARALLAAIAASSAAAANGPAQFGAWKAVLVDDGLGERTVICWREGVPGEAVLTGTWQQGMLTDLALRVGERGWGARQTAAGESLWSPGFEATGPGDRQPGTDLEARARAELRRWKEEHPAAHSLTPDVGAAAAATLFIPRLAASPEKPAASPKAAAEELRCDVILRAVPAAQCAAVARLVQVARRAAGEAPAELAYAEQLVAGVPSTIRRRTTRAEAEFLRRELTALGAEVEVYRAADR